MNFFQHMQRQTLYDIINFLPLRNIVANDILTTQTT